MKKTLKMASLWIAILLVSPLLAVWKIYYAFSKREKLFVSISQLLSLCPGKIGVHLRRGFYYMALRECGDDVSIDFGTFFSHFNIDLGRRVYIGSRCIIGMATIGDGVMIGSNVDMLSGRNQHRRDEQGRLLGSEHGEFKMISIGANSWIGNSTVILADVGMDCTVGAGSVVVHPIAEQQTVVGNPARSI
jgi:virginiamycin A acetyltransferase